MDLREIESNELHKLLDLYDHLHKADDPQPSEAMLNTVWNTIQNNKDIKYFGLFIENLLLSSCTIILVPNLTRSCRPYGVVENVVTHSHYRNCGYGKMVLKAALSFAWNSNCYKVLLMTGRLNEATFKFYESAGFNRNSKQAFIAKPHSFI